MLIQKNLVYRKLCRLDEAIERKLIWVKTKEDEKKISVFEIFAIVIIGLVFVLYWNQQNEQVLVSNLLFSILFFMKILFYVPAVNVRIIEDEHKLKFINEFEDTQIDFYTYKIEAVEIVDNQIKITTRESVEEIEMNFADASEKDRLKEFFLQTIKSDATEIRNKGHF